MENDCTLKIQFLNDFLRDKLLLLIRDIRGDGSALAAFRATTLGVFYGVPLISLKDNQYLLDRELAFLRGYREYLYRMLYAEVLVAYNAGRLQLDERFASPFLERVEMNDFGVSSNVEYSVNFLAYYVKALELNKEMKFPIDTLIRLRRIDPLYHK